MIALGTSEALHVMRTDPKIASCFESRALPSRTANEQLPNIVAGFLQQIDIESGDLVNNQVAMDYLLELTSGVTGRIVEVMRLGARCALRRDSRILSIGCLQDAGKEFAADLGSERYQQLVSLSSNCVIDRIKGTGWTPLRAIHFRTRLRRKRTELRRNHNVGVMPISAWGQSRHPAKCGGKSAGFAIPDGETNIRHGGGVGGQ
jgi:hypothetical protein